VWSTSADEEKPVVLEPEFLELKTPAIKVKEGWCRYLELHAYVHEWLGRISDACRCC